MAEPQKSIAKLTSQGGHLVLREFAAKLTPLMIVGQLDLHQPRVNLT